MTSHLYALKAITADRPIAFHPLWARVLGGINQALFFQQVAYWLDRSDDEWLRKTRDDFEQELAMSRREQEAARAGLVELGVLKEERRGLPASMHYRIDWDRALALLEHGQLVGTKAPNCVGGNVPTTRARPDPVLKRDEEETKKNAREATNSREMPTTFSSGDDKTGRATTSLPVAQQTPPPPTAPAPADEVWTHFKQAFDWKGNTPPRDRINARLKRYTVEQLKQAISNVAQDVWYMTNQRHNAASFLFRSDINVDKYLAMVPRKAGAPVKTDGGYYRNEFGVMERERYYRDLPEDDD